MGRIFLILCLFPSFLKAQDLKSLGQIHGNFQIDMQYYNKDSLIGAAVSPERLSSNAFSNLIYTKDNFSAGIRFESYLNTLQGFSQQYNGTGIPYRFASFKKDLFDITVGNYYEQFGTGVILRTYEERGLGYDNAMDGARIKFFPVNGIKITGVIGKQRKYWEKSEGIVRGVDLDLSVNQLFDSLLNATQIDFGASMVSKYQPDQSSVYNLPQNVAAFSARGSVSGKSTRFFMEYAYKINDPSQNNNYLYKPGQSLIVQSSYFKDAFGISVDLKRTDNMSFRSEREASLSDVLINYIPAFTKQHTYNLLATLYPYGTQLNGEIGGQGEISYKFKKGTVLGGKYGTSVLLNYSLIHNLDTNRINDLETSRIGYTASLIGLGEQYFQDANIEISKKLSPKVRSTIIYAHITYNKDVIEGKINYGLIRSHIAVMDLAYKFNSKNTLRTELQGLFTKQDQGSWATILLEYTHSPNWYIALMDQYNYGNSYAEKRLHYYFTSVGYIMDASRLSLSYGRQRAGIFCVGGVCRNVPASNGLSISLSTTF